MPSCEFPVSVRLTAPELWHHEGVPLCLPHSASRSHNPTHIWKWEEGNPRWWLKGFCCQGEFSPHLFFGVCTYVCMSISNVYHCVHYPLELKSFPLWGIQNANAALTAAWNNSLCLDLYSESGNQSDVVFLFITCFSWQPWQFKMHCGEYVCSRKSALSTL